MTTRDPRVGTIRQSSPQYDGPVYCISAGCHGAGLSLHMEQDVAEKLYARLGRELRENTPKKKSA